MRISDWSSDVCSSDLPLRRPHYRATHIMTQPTRRLLSLKREATPQTNSKLEERLHKVLAQAGLGSRRALEERINNGQVKVNGEVATVGQSVHSGDRIELARSEALR